jgi:hypothetical protein
MSCQIVTQRYEDWKDEMPWLTGYFTLAVWCSLYMAHSDNNKVAVKKKKQ